MAVRSTPATLEAGISSMWVALILVLLGLTASIILYASVYTVTKQATKTSMASGAVVVNSVRAGIGYVDIYVTSIGVEAKADTVYLYDCAQGSWKLVARISLPKPVRLSPGSITLIHVPLVGLGLDVSKLPTTICLALGTSSGLVARSTRPVNMAYYMAMAASKAVIGLLAGRDVSCSTGDRRVNPNQIHWVYINLVTGRYEFGYKSGSTLKTVTGKATILRTSLLDLSKLSWDERYKLGPVVVFINPYYASKPYTVTIIDIKGVKHVFNLPRLVDDPTKVSLDIVAAWEDLWWPGTKAPLDNYIDHVIRLTVYTNNTVRIEVLEASGCYLHMFFLNPPPFNNIPSIVSEYESNEFRLPASSGVVYVKTHDASVPPIGPRKLWDPVNGVWVTSWPPVFIR